MNDIKGLCKEIHFENILLEATPFICCNKTESCPSLFTLTRLDNSNVVIIKFIVYP